MARLDAGVALDDRVDRVEAFAEIAGDQHFAAAEAQHERGGSVLHAEGAVQSGHDDSFCSYSVGQVTKEYHNYCINPQVLYKFPVQKRNCGFFANTPTMP